MTNSIFGFLIFTIVTFRCVLKNCLINPVACKVRVSSKNQSYYRVSGNRYIFFIMAISVIISTEFVVYSNAITGTAYYVDAENGSDSNSGNSPSQAWRTIGMVNTSSLTPGDGVLFKRNQSWSGELSLSSAGTAKSPIVVGAYGNGDDPIITRLFASRDHVIYEHIVVDHQKADSDALRVRGAKHNIFRNVTIKNGTRDGLDADKANGILIENCHIHHFLGGSFKNQFDAHGMVFTDTVGITIRNTEVHHVSGDSFQTDPDRDSITPDTILIEDCHFWTGPLKKNFNAKWPAGKTPGENAIDTKMITKNWSGSKRMRITIKNMVAHGFINDGFIPNRAVFNMKEKIEAVFDRVTVYDSEIAFRLRGTRGNANVTLKNAVIHRCEKAIRAEDNVANLNVYNSTFGASIGKVLEMAGGSGGTGSWDWRNNAFISEVPSVVSSSSNLLASPSDFLKSTKGDYHLENGSVLINSGQTIASVATDRDGTKRLTPYEIGAYEFTEKETPPIVTEKDPIPVLSPPVLSATVISSTAIELDWTDNSNNKYGFQIERKKGNESFKEISHVDANTSRYQDTGLQASTRYSYRVRAENSTGPEAYSNIVTKRTKGEISSFPVVLQGKKLPENKMVSLEVNKPSSVNGKATLAMEVFDANRSREGKLVINGKGSIRLFDTRAKSRNGGKTVTITFTTPARWWNNGVNTLQFLHTSSAGFRIESASVDFLENAPAPSSFPVVLLGKKRPEEKTVSLKVDKPSVSSGKATLTMMVYDANRSKEGKLVINRKGSIDLFGKGAKSRNHGETVPITFTTPARWWKNGVNSLQFLHTSSSGFRIESASVDFKISILPPESSVEPKSFNKPISSTLYEDAEDGGITGWHKYKGGTVRNIIGGADRTKHAIETMGNIRKDVFRLGKENKSPWNNTKEFTAEFSVALENPNSGAIYFQISTSEGTKFLMYMAERPSTSIASNLIYISLGKIADGKWHAIQRNLEEDLKTKFPAEKLKRVKNFFVYGSLKLDNIKLSTYK